VVGVFSASSAPHGLYLDASRKRLIVNNFLASSVTAHAAADRRMSKDNYMSCASCHADGGDDGMVWDFTQRGEGLRRTISLQGRAGLGHGKLHWSANFDEVQDFENDMRNAFDGTGFLSDADFAATQDPLGTPKAGRSSQLDDMAAYLTSLNKFMRSPVRAAIRAAPCATVCGTTWERSSRPPAWA
jgi:hypothetical protein